MCSCCLSQFELHCGRKEYHVISESSWGKFIFTHPVARYKKNVEANRTTKFMLFKIYKNAVSNVVKAVF